MTQGAIPQGLLFQIAILEPQHSLSPPGPSLQSTAPQYRPQAFAQQIPCIVGCEIP